MNNAFKAGIDVFVLQRTHHFEDGGESVKLLGVYSTQIAAEKAIQKALAQPGFCDAPEGFSVDCYPLDKDHWTEGYVTDMKLL